MRILLIELGGYAGTFQYTHNLANALVKRNHEVALATAIDFETKRFPVHYHALEVFDKIKPHPLRIFNLIRYVKKTNPEIIHIQGHLHPTSYLILWKVLKLFCSAHFVYTAQDIEPKKLKRHHPWSLNKLYKTTEHIFVNAHQNETMLLEKFTHVTKKKVTVIPLADLTAFVPKQNSTRPSALPENKKVILFFGNIEPRKGLLPLIQAFPLVKKSISNAFLHIVGKPFTDMTPYKDEIKKLGIDGDLLLEDEYLPMEDLPCVFEKCKIVALPYTQGWNSAVIATAYSHHKPVVVSDIGGFHEVVNQGETGILVPPGDITALADAIIKMLGDETLYNNMIREITSHTKLHSWDEVAKKSEFVYQQVLDKT